jgi:TolB-like protein
MPENQDSRPDHNQMSDIYRFAGLELDASRFQIRRDGQVLSVQPQVFDVLQYLIVHRHRIVPKEELLDKVWNGRFISETTLSSRIKAVRRLIGDTGKDQVLLQTVRNRGFRYVGDVEAQLTHARQISSAPAARGSGGPATGVAVLPFEMIGEAVDQSYFGEGIAGDIISLLARHPWLKVIARGSSFAVDPLGSTPQQIGATLGVKYLLSGRIRRSGERMRIDAELADCASARHLWSQRYEISRTDLFAVQEAIGEQIAAAIEPRLGQFERQRIRSKPPEDLDAWDCCHKGLWHLYRFTVDDLELAKVCFRGALEIDPDLARAHSGLAYASVQLAFYGAPSRRGAELQSALAASQRAVALDPWDAFNRFALGRSLCLMRRFSEAEIELQAAIEANHSFAQAHFALAFCLTVWDRPADAIGLYETAVRLSPQDPHIWTFHHMRSMAHFRLDQTDEAESFVRAAVRQQNATYWPFATLCALLGELGRIDEAAAIADRLVKMKPGYSLQFARQDFFFMLPSKFIERYLRGLERAGIPACPNDQTRVLECSAT